MIPDSSLSRDVSDQSSSQCFALSSLALDGASAFSYLPDQIVSGAEEIASFTKAFGKLVPLEKTESIQSYFCWKKVTGKQKSGWFGGSSPKPDFASNALVLSDQRLVLTKEGTVVEEMLVEEIRKSSPSSQ